MADDETFDLRVMTSGAFTAAHLTLLPQIEQVTGKKVITVTTTVGSGETSIPNRLRRGEIADIVIVADDLMQNFIADKLVLAESYTPLVRSFVGMAVRAGAAKPDIASADAIKRTLLNARAIGHAGSVSGDYLTQVLVQRLGIAGEVLPKCRYISGREGVSAAIARGELDIGFQQVSELLPMPGIAHITALPPEFEKVSVFSAGVGASTTDKHTALAAIRFLASPAAHDAIIRSGMQPIVLG